MTQSGHAANWRNGVLVGELLLQRRCLAGLFGVVAISLFHLLQFDCHFVDMAGEFERHPVSPGDGRALIHTHVRALIRREDTALGVFDPTCRNSFSVDEEGAYTAFADAVTIIRELETDGRLSGRLTYRAGAT